MWAVQRTLQSGLVTRRGSGARLRRRAGVLLLRSPQALAPGVLPQMDIKALTAVEGECKAGSEAFGLAPRMGRESADLDVTLKDRGELDAHFLAAVEMLRQVGLFIFIDTIAQRRELHLLVRPHEAERFAALAPNAMIAVDPGLNDLSEISQTVQTWIDCRPLPVIREEARVFDGEPIPTLIEDALACLQSGTPDLLTLHRRPSVSGKRYYIFSTPRSGSTFLSELLSGTECLGRPSEHIKSWMKNVMVASGLTVANLLDRLHCYSATANGVFGSKIIINDLFALFPNFEKDFLEEFARNECFMLIRGDKASQAISNVRSNQLSIYHVRNNEEGRQAQAALSAFDPAFLDLFKSERWLLRQEADLLMLLKSKGIWPRLISYEAVSQSQQMAEAAIHDIARTIGVQAPAELRWSRLKKISALGGSSHLTNYLQMRRHVALYSTRSEPSLGEVLGDGWQPLAAWGARTAGPRAEILLGERDEPKAVEINFFIPPDLRPDAMTVGRRAFPLDPLAQGTIYRRWVGLTDGAMADGKLLIDTVNGQLSVTEVVFYYELPEAFQKQLATAPFIVLDH